MRRMVALALVVAVGALTACNDDGRTLAPAPETTTTLAPSTTAPPAADGRPFALTSSQVSDGAMLDPAFTCDGTNVHPELTITGVPAGTAELALTMVDLDADGYVHWVLAGLPPTLARIDSGVSPPGAVSARTDSGVVGWDGPCPPEDDGPHRYRFTVHASPEPIGLAPGLDGRAAIDLIDDAATAQAELTVRYDRAS